MRKFIVIICLLVLVLVPNIVLAHPGRTDSSGCHTCRTNCSRWGLRNGQYHCHGGTSTSKSSSSSKNSTPKVTKSSNNKLDNIRINGKNYTTGLDTIEYKTFDSKITIEAEASDSKAKVTVENKDLNIGENKIIVKVTAENGKVKSYPIKVIREKKSDNTNLKVFVDGKELIFEDELCEIEVLNDVTKLNYRYELEDEKATLQISEKDFLEEGENVLIFFVTAQDGSKKDYKLIVNRATKIEENKKINEEQDNSIYSSFVIAGMACATLFWKQK